VFGGEIGVKRYLAFGILNYREQEITQNIKFTLRAAHIISRIDSSVDTLLRNDK
jgi:hypothetical protein